MCLGGRETNKHQSKKAEGTQGRSTKTPIFGMVQRDGLVHALKVSDTKASTLLPIIKQFCAENSHFFTDELSSYSCLDKAGMSHSVIEHGRKEFSRIYLA